MDEVKPPRRWTQTRVGARAQKAEATRLSLIAAGRALFSERGYHAVSIRDVAAMAGVTRGAFAHHFPDKEALFLAVFDQIEGELLATPEQPPSEADPWVLFRAGVQAYLAAATRRDVQRITLIEGPAVLGWRRWRELEEHYSLGRLTGVLNAAMETGHLKRRAVEPLAQLVLGSVMEAALLVANSDDPSQRREQVGQALDELLAGLEQR